MRTLSDLFGDLRWRGNIYLALIQRLLIVLLLFSVCRMGFYLFNHNFFEEVTISSLMRMMIGGLRFDLTAVLYINSLFILLHIVPLNIRFHSVYQQVLKYLFFGLNGIALALNVSDVVYYRFTLRRTTADIFQQFENETNLGFLFIRFLIDYWYAVIFWLVLLAAMVWLYKRVQVAPRMTKNHWVYYAGGILVLPVILYLFVGGVRGGFAHSTRPITLSNAGEYVRHPKEVSIVLNTPFAIFRTLGKTKIQKSHYFEDEEELKSLFDPVHRPADSIPMRNENVVVIILESFSKEFIGALNRDKQEYSGYTPFLDSLLQHSLTFEHSFANGRKSIDGLPSILASVPSLGVPYVLTPFSNNTINSLGSLLRDKGYHTSFFHGAPNGSMGFNAFTNLAGFEYYFGKNEYEAEVATTADHFDGIWGIWDDRFFDFYADKLNQFPQPFMSSVFSVSSHHPFKVPARFEGRFAGGDQPILKCIEYTDYALKEFFKKVSDMPWYENTLFVITADHCSSNVLFEESRTSWGLFSVPVIFFKPDNSLAQRKAELAQQIDIMPSVLGYLQYDQPYVAFGRDVFHEATKPFAFNYRDAYQYFQDEYLLIFDGQQTLNLFDYRNDRLLQHDLKNEKPEVVAELERKLMAILQQYNNRMIDNRLLPD